jgi:hypothetical protein
MATGSSTARTRRLLARGQLTREKPGARRGVRLAPPLQELELARPASRAA